jgi:hypothetical protein
MTSTPALDQGGDALVIIRTDADGSADQQTALGVLAGQWVFAGLADVLDRDQALEGEVVVDHHQALQAMLVQQSDDIFLADALFHRDQTLARRHDMAHMLVQVGLETQVAIGDDADHLARLVDHRQARDAVTPGNVQNIANTHGRTNGDRILDHTGLMALDLGHLGSLLLGRQVLVDDADAALLGHGDGHGRFGDSIHGGGNHRHIQLDATGETSLQADIAGQDAGFGGDEQDVVEGERFLQNTHI